jgi:starch phosphorylase
MSEALEKWDETLLKNLLPRIYAIICEINRRHCAAMFEQHYANGSAVQRMSIVLDRQIRMANLAVVGSHTVNGVSKLHSQILKDEVFADFAGADPHKFTNVTNGIASRRWLLQANRNLTALIANAIGADFKDNIRKLSALHTMADDKAFLQELAAAKLRNKVAFCQHLERKTRQKLDPASVFDVQVKRLHEYKRQQMNALDIIATCQWIKENPQAEFVPRTYIFGAKAAPGYYMAKQIIKLLCVLSKMVKNDPALRDKLRVVFLEEYNVTMSETLMPASEISEQISLAGTEASGTGNMKMMLNGALTLGTLDGANVEIHDVVGDDNIFIFGMNKAEVVETARQGYRPRRLYEQDPVIRKAVDALMDGFVGDQFPDIYNMLLNKDDYMTLQDFTDYRRQREELFCSYTDSMAWQRKSLINIAESGHFCADRAVDEYAENIWRLEL